MANGNMRGQGVTPEQAAQLAAASSALLGRYQAPELLFSQSIDLDAPSTLLVPRNINLTRPLESLTIRLRFRATVAVADYAAVSPEAPQNILQMIQLQGIHRSLGNITPIRLSGSLAYAWGFIFGMPTSSDILTGAAATRVADPGRPLTSPFLGTVGASPYDMDLIYHVPLGPMFGLGKGVKRDWINFLYMPQDWNDSLQLQLTFGDESALGDPTGSTVTFTGFGGTGSELLEIYGNYAILGQFASAMRTGVCVRTENPLTGFTALATSTRLTTLQKQITTAIVLRTGVRETTGQSAGVTTLESVSDLQLDRTKVMVDNKPVRNNESNLVYKSYYQRMLGRVIPQGYFSIPFVEGQNALLAYRGDGLAGGSTFELVSDVDSASANNFQSFVQEMILGGPYPAVR